jgi:hypothetical protein
MTAKHVVESDLDKAEERGLEAWVLRDGICYPCPIGTVQLHPTADIAIANVGVPMQDGRVVPGFKISICEIDDAPAAADEEAVTYGYPRTQFWKSDAKTVQVLAKPDYYAGKIRQRHPTGFTLANWPAYSHTVPIAAGMSGGPLFRKKDWRVLGVNCSGMSTEREDVEYGTATDVLAALDMPLALPITDFEGKPLRTLLAAGTKNRAVTAGPP